MNEIQKTTEKIKQYNKILRAIKNTISVDIKVSRNEKCPCGSGKKFKNCCLK